MGVLCQALSGQSHRLPDWLKYVCPVAFSSFGGHMILVLLKDLEGHGRSGEIVVARYLSDPTHHHHQSPPPPPPPHSKKA